MRAFVGRGGVFRGFLGKIRRFRGETLEKGCLMSGAAARTEDLKRKEEEVGALVMGGYEPNPILWAVNGVPKDFNFKLLDNN